MKFLLAKNNRTKKRVRELISLSLANMEIPGATDKKQTDPSTPTSWPLAISTQEEPVNLPNLVEHLFVFFYLLIIPVVCLNLFHAEDHADIRPMTLAPRKKQDTAIFFPIS